jgi:hypothetical protein
MIPKSAILVAAFALAIINVASASQPLHYDRPVTLSGVISPLQFYGLPDFGERPSTDARETAIILNLDKPMDVIATTFTGPNMDSWHNERRVQLDDFTAPQCLLRLVGRQITVRGTLYDHVQIFDRTDVVMEVSALIHPAGLNK